MTRRRRTPPAARTPTQPAPQLDVRRIGRLLFDVLLLGVLAVTAVVVVRTVLLKEEFAQASDPFCYLQMAADIRQGSAPHGLPRFTFDAPHTRAMLAFLRQRGLPLDNATGIAPDGYHYQASTDQIICQYPPGTGAMLSLLPAGAALITWRVATVVVLAALGIVCLIWRRAGGVGALAPAMMTTAVACGMCVPLLTVSYSVDLLLLPLAAAVIAALESRRRGWIGWTLLALAGALLGWAVVVRIAAAFFLPGLLLAALRTDAGGWHRRAGRVATALAAFGIGVLPLLAHQHAMTGAWLRSTYTPVDTTPPSLQFMGRNLTYYFFGDGNALVLYLAIGALAAAAWIITWRGADWRRVGSGLATAGLWFLAPTAYFATHAVVTPYYQLLTLFVTLLAFGWLMRQDQAAPPKPGWRPILGTTAAGLSAACLVVLLLQFSWPTEEFARLAATPNTTPPPALADPHAWILADRVAGTLWYYNGIAAVDPVPLDDATRQAFFQWLRARGEKVYLVEDNLPMSDLLRQLDAAGVRSTFIGRYSETPGGQDPFTEVYRLDW